jgi:hypothetical protein
LKKIRPKVFASFYEISCNSRHPFSGQTSSVNAAYDKPVYRILSSFIESWTPKRLANDRKEPYEEDEI